MKTLTRNHVSTNSTHLSARATQCPPIRADSDVTLSIAGVMAGLFRRLLPDRYSRLVEAALRRRAYVNLRLARAADDPEDRQLPTMWERRQPKVVHWEVAGDSPASPEDKAFAACGRHSGVSMQDKRWQHGTEESRPVTCAHCKALLQAAKG
jgi:hypothetical protein